MRKSINSLFNPTDEMENVRYRDRRDAGKFLAKRLAKEADTEEGRIIRAYRLLFGRKPTPSEIRIGLDFLQPAADSTNAAQKTQRMQPPQPADG